MKQLASFLRQLRIDCSAPSTPYGMWRAVLAATLLCVATQPAVFTEGGSVDGETIFQSEYDYPKQKDIYSEEEIAEVEDKIKQWYAEERQEEERERESNKQMIDILKVLEKQRTDETEFPDEVEIDLQKTKALPKDEIQSPTTAKEAELEKEEAANDIIETQPLVAQKKGQNEFVSFVEPVDAKQTKSVPSLEKRRLATSSDNLNFVPTYSTNLLMLAVGSVLIVGMIGTVVGGGIYLKRRRDTPDDAEYAPYAGTGPGFKKGKGDKGDESLAYKAQLHHYQQAKQKIICGDDAPAGLESEGEDDGVDDENNFSVYECPGLAPTGDIEVCNPNFAAQP